MSFQPDSFVAATEIAPLPDMKMALRAFSKSARAARMGGDSYPGRTELVAILNDARARIERINAAQT